jgi:Response regulator of the LytR/AlgR family
MATYMLRCTSIRFEEMVAGTCIRRCHRSFFVNTRRIRSIVFENRRVFAILDMPSSREIPVSKTYQKEFEELGV